MLALDQLQSSDSRCGGGSLKPGPHQQQCRSNIVKCYKVEYSFDKGITLLRHCCRFWWQQWWLLNKKARFVAKNDNNVERVLRWNFVLSPKLNVASTKSNVAKKLPVASTVLLGHCCWCGPGLRIEPINVSFVLRLVTSDHFSGQVERSAFCVCVWISSDNKNDIWTSYLAKWFSLTLAIVQVWWSRSLAQVQCHTRRNIDGLNLWRNTRITTFKRFSGTLDTVLFRFRWRLVNRWIWRRGKSSYK